jgi:hypothetical protein
MPVTLTDIELASAYYPILINLAKKKQTVSYGELVNLAKNDNPDKAGVQNAIPVSTGRRLEVVRKFTTQKNLPDITALVVNGNAGECGDNYLAHFDAEAIREEIYEYDWEGVSNEFNLYLTEIRPSEPRPSRSREIAIKLMADHYRNHRNDYFDNIADNRELIITQLMEGYAVKDCFEPFLRNAF